MILIVIEFGKEIKFFIYNNIINKNNNIMTNSKLYIVTVATEIKYYMKYLIESIKKFNCELKILFFY